jgi:hypothetical protein
MRTLKTERNRAAMAGTFKLHDQISFAKGQR